jgi:hypothetical protein
MVGEQECNLFCYRLQDSTFYLSLFQTLFVGPAGGLAFDNTADLTNELGRLGVSSADQTAIVNMNPNGSYVISKIEVPDSNTQAFGIPLHDGDLPDESNDIVITRVQANPLVVDVFLNHRKRGHAKWKPLKDCLESYTSSPGGSAGYTAAQLNQIETDLKGSAGVSTLAPSNGSEGAIVGCIKKNRP